MKQPKRFDAVEMKWNLQQSIDQEFAGWDEHEAWQEQRRRAEADPILGPYMQRVRQAHEERLKQELAQSQRGSQRR